MKRLILVLALFCPVSLLSHFQAGKDAWQQRDYATAYRGWLPLAKLRSCRNPVQPRGEYDKGHGVPQDYALVAVIYWD